MDQFVSRPEVIAAIIALVLGLLVVSGRRNGKNSARKPLHREPALAPPSPFKGAAQTAPLSAKDRPHHGPSPPATGLRVATAARWIPSTEAVTIAGTNVPRGMIYLGSDLRAPNGQDEKSLIDPALPIARSGAGDSGLHYWPSYATLTPAGRRCFIDWLAGGRRDPSMQIGFVFIFFYGLERRLFLDRSMEDAQLITAEVERLLAIYGNNASFNRYSTLFLEASRFLRGDLSAPAPSLSDNHDELPLAVRLHIGGLLAAGKTVDAQAALAWVLGHPETRLRTPARRCFDELQSLWSVRFAERNPAGLAVRAPKRRLALTYRAASGAFTATLSAEGNDLPDIVALRAPLQGLYDLLESVTTELEPYSRLLGRRPEARQALESALLLPAPIRDLSNPALGAARSRLDSLFGADTIITTSQSTVSGLLGIEGPAEAGAQRGARLALALDHLDIGMEPDRRYGAPSLGPGETIALFRAPSGGPIAAGRQAFDTARTVIEIGVLAALSDGAITTAELTALTRQVRGASGLNPVERLRLEAFLRSLTAEPPRLQAALRRAGSLPAAERAAIAHAAIGAVLADGEARGDEVRFLERLHRGLGLKPEDIHAKLHQRAAARDAPITITSDDQPADIPLPMEKVTGRTSRAHVALDHDRLARIRDETRNVAALLEGVFAEPEPQAAAARAPADSPPSQAQLQDGTYPGLDAAHGALLAFAASAGGRVSLEAFEAEAKARGLFPGAAMETINDWGFSMRDEAILEEDDDAIIVPDHVLPDLALTDRVHG